MTGNTYSNNISNGLSTNLIEIIEHVFWLDGSVVAMGDCDSDADGGVLKELLCYQLRAWPATQHTRLLYSAGCNWGGTGMMKMNFRTTTSSPTPLILYLINSLKST